VRLFHLGNEVGRADVEEVPRGEGHEPGRIGAGRGYVRNESPPRGTWLRRQS
jgi:hypothetical protein